MKKRSSRLAALAVGAAMLAGGTAQAQAPDFKTALRAGIGKLLDNDYAEAGKELRHAQELAVTPKEKGDVLTWFYLLHNTTRDYPAARAAMQQLLKIEGIDNRMRLRARRHLADAYLEEKNFEQARREYEICLADPNESSIGRYLAQRGVADAYLGEKNFVQARGTYVEIETEFLAPDDEDSSPEDSRTRVLMARLGIAKTFVGEKNYAQARAFLLQAAAVTGTEDDWKPRIQFDLAYTFVGEKNYAQARVEYQKLLAMPEAGPWGPMLWKAEARKRLKLLDALDTAVTPLERDAAVTQLEKGDFEDPTVARLG